MFTHNELPPAEPHPLRIHRLPPPSTSSFLNARLFFFTMAALVRLEGERSVAVTRPGHRPMVMVDRPDPSPTGARSTLCFIISYYTLNKAGQFVMHLWKGKKIFGVCREVYYKLLRFISGYNSFDINREVIEG